jgi:hypothetical protein
MTKMRNSKTKYGRLQSKYHDCFIASLSDDCYWMATKQTHRFSKQSSVTGWQRGFVFATIRYQQMKSETLLSDPVPQSIVTGVTALSQVQLLVTGWQQSKRTASASNRASLDGNEDLFCDNQMSTDDKSCERYFVLVLHHNQLLLDGNNRL